MNSAYPPEHPDHPPVPGGYRDETFETLLRSPDARRDVNPEQLLKLVRLACRDRHPLLYAFLQFECHDMFDGNLELRTLYHVPNVTLSGYFHTQLFERYSIHPAALACKIFSWLKLVERNCGKYLLECLKK